ncbi:hypothetical protein [Pilimelia columellifera]|uniref:Uncharacterized protein n=1 Tax=Pilimelia columellifera subsp. columellifera TaxID=706583 RepID=A0ABN3NJ38_9ACTN
MSTQPPARPRPQRGVAVLAALAFLWLAGTLWSAHRSIEATTGVVALAVSAYALPGLVGAALVAGLGAGLLTLRRVDPALTRPVGFRFVAALGAGLAVALAAGGAFAAVAGGDPQRLILAATLAGAAILGGALAANRAPHTQAGVVAAALAMFVTGLALALARGPVFDWLYEPSAADRVDAETWYAILTALIGGVAAGVVAYRALRRRRSRWLAYLVAGAGPGALLLIGEVIIRIGGSSLLYLTRQISDADRTMQQWTDGSRINHAMVVMFLGGIVALVGYGRSLGPGQRS